MFASSSEGHYPTEGTLMLRVPSRNVHTSPHSVPNQNSWRTPIFCLPCSTSKTRGDAPSPSRSTEKTTKSYAENSPRVRSCLLSGILLKPLSHAVCTWLLPVKVQPISSWSTAKRNLSPLCSDLRKAICSSRSATWNLNAPASASASLAWAALAAASCFEVSSAVTFFSISVLASSSSRTLGGWCGERIKHCLATSGKFDHAFWTSPKRQVYPKISHNGKCRLLPALNVSGLSKAETRACILLFRFPCSEP